MNAKTANKITGSENAVVMKVKGGQEVRITRGDDGLWSAPGVKPSRNLRIVRAALRGITTTA